MPLKVAGRVYCGYSNKPSAKLSPKRARFGAQDAGEFAHHGVDDHHGCQLAAGEHVIAQRDDLIGQRVGSLVDALVVAADEQQAILLGKLAGARVVKTAALRGKEDSVGLGSLSIGRGWGGVAKRLLGSGPSRNLRKAPVQQKRQRPPPGPVRQGP